MKRILVIDDDDAMRGMVCAVLAREGYEVLDAADGEQGIRLRSELPGDRPLDLVIVDIFMPDKDGLETIMELRGTGEGCPILAMSGGGAIGEMAFLDYSCKFGAQALLAKPFPPSVLLAEVRRLLDPASATDDAPGAGRACVPSDGA
ncbi:response regulator receiver protein [Desulfovibrio sp. X2]|uniref:response regulator transcription factor n=1 Tax=Desulfovibrio sp. X2 TaxID=941449 RepID=UPI00035880B5|nr:response regulator [Desulfovibrio sp. X2]EPR44372.1 response regulator receiver protein [Desulfovibrio sp. X2]